MQIKRVALFRYHTGEYEDYKQRLLFFKRLNPDVKVFGIFGGEREKFDEATENLQDCLETNYFLDHPDPLVKALGGDIACQRWYRDVGWKYDFDVVHPLEWDLVFMDRLDRVYANCPADRISCTGLVKLKKIREKWYWTRDKERKKEWQEILKEAKEEYGYNDTPHAMLGPAAAFPRAYLEKLVSVKIPEINVDELRTPLFGQILGFKLHDNRFYRKWFSGKEARVFNCNKLPINFSVIEKQVGKKRGRRVFHPYVDKFDYSAFNDLYERYILKSD